MKQYLNENFNQLGDNWKKLAAPVGVVLVQDLHTNARYFVGIKPETYKEGLDAFINRMDNLAKKRNGQYKLHTFYSQDEITRKFPIKQSFAYATTYPIGPSQFDELLSRSSDVQEHELSESLKESYDFQLRDEEDFKSRHGAFRHHGEKGLGSFNHVEVSPKINHIVLNLGNGSGEKIFIKDANLKPGEYLIRISSDAARIINHEGLAILNPEKGYVRFMREMTEEEEYNDEYESGKSVEFEKKKTKLRYLTLVENWKEKLNHQ